MKRILYMGAAALLTMAGCTQQSAPRLVQPLPPSPTLESLDNATVSASFTANDFDWTANTLRLTAYTEQVYDSVEVSQLQTGDTLIYNNNRIVVDSLVKNESFITINNGITEGGADLEIGKKGTYRAIELDDHSIYTALGEVTLPFRSDFTLIFCGENPNDPYDTIRVDQQTYLNNLADYLKEFSSIDCKIRIENDTIVSITRFWIP